MTYRCPDESVCVSPTICHARKACSAGKDPYDTPRRGRDEAAAVLGVQCKADSHVGPATISGATLRCANCGETWWISKEPPPVKPICPHGVGDPKFCVQCSLGGAKPTG